MFGSDGKGVSQRHLLRLLKDAQYDELTVSLERKIIHGAFFKQCQEEEWDTSGSHVWLLDGRVQAQTKALIMAAQDVFILTHAFQSRVMGKTVSLSCRACNGAAETVGYILSSCALLHWMLYKERHNRVLYQMVCMLATKYDIIIAKRSAVGTGQVERSVCFGRKDLKLVTYVNVLMDQQLSVTTTSLVPCS